MVRTDACSSIRRFNGAREGEVKGHFLLQGCSRWPIKEMADRNGGCYFLRFPLSPPELRRVVGRAEAQALQRQPEEERLRRSGERQRRRWRPLLQEPPHVARHLGTAVRLAGNPAFDNVPWKTHIIAYVSSSTVNAISNNPHTYIMSASGGEVKT